ncbi:MAG: carboxypeptidase regulatory-like domain-containing protein [Lentimicrobiaceae bacterium]|nr:carboxypeptidase regulatory-like domain-containing protein [Lentimicrobiaceae bacterium]MCB9023236.1 carboxypeptidase regulatory-like domain-containing protein [Lentimicrobiaceae bacterium]
MKTFLTFAFSLAFFIVSAQVSIKEADVDQLFNSKGEIYFALPHSGSSAGQLTNLISIDNVRGDTVFAYANRKEFVKLQNAGERSFILLKHPGTLINPVMSSDLRQIQEWDSYPTYTAYEQMMEQFAADYPSICSLHTIAVLPSGRKILAVRITDNVNIDEDEPEFLYTSTMHGDETTGYILNLRLIDYLLSNYGQNARVTNMVNNIDIWINPLANPDGTYAGGNNSVYGAMRYNANYVDLNRNYPDPEDGPHPDGEAWQPETIGFMNFAENHSFVMSANFHGGAEVINYPWDTWSRLAADNNWWVMVSREYADTCHVNSPAGYMTYLNNGITNGYAWYTTAGCRQDYMNYFQQCRECTIELSDTKLLQANQLPSLWNYNYRSLLNYIEQSNYGVRGIVTDTVTGEPLKAQVFIFGHDMDSSMVFTSLPVGDYHRLLKAGTYNLTFSAPGYNPKTINNVVVTDKNTVRLDVQLWNGAASASFTSSDTITHAGGTIQFFDNSTGNPTSRLWTFEGGNIATSTLPDPIVTYNEPGEYEVKLFVSNAMGGNELVKQDYITVTPDYYIGNLNPTTCFARFYDSKGPESDYQAGENSVTTITAADNTRVLRISFTSLDIESSEGCVNDVLNIYDGPDTNAPLLMSVCGSEIPDDILSSVGGGSVTFEFKSNGSINGAGWSAIVKCDSGVGISEKPESTLRIYPNPVANGEVNIESAEPVEWIEILDFAGRVVYKTSVNTSKTSIATESLKTGLYLVNVKTRNGISKNKLQVIGQ